MTSNNSPFYKGHIRGPYPQAINETLMVAIANTIALRFPEIKNPSIDITYLRVEIDILSGEESFNECISRICFS